MPQVRAVTSERGCDWKRVKRPRWSAARGERCEVTGNGGRCSAVRKAQRCSREGASREQMSGGFLNSA